MLSDFMITSLEYGLNSESIAELLNKETGKNYGESTYRKFYSAYKKVSSMLLLITAMIPISKRNFVSLNQNVLNFRQKNLNTIT